MTLVHRAEVQIYRCDACGAERDYLSTSWSEITLYRFEDHKPQLLHHCLECRSNKKEWHEPAQ